MQYLHSLSLQEADQTDNRILFPHPGRNFPNYHLLTSTQFKGFHAALSLKNGFPHENIFLRLYFDGRTTLLGSISPDIHSEDPPSLVP